MQHQFQLAAGKGQSFDKAEKLVLHLESFFQDYTPYPSLLHGDLWGGNASPLMDGRGTIYDPASWWADAEVDLAMTRLFGGFGQRFYRSYDAVNPPLPGANERFEIYNLYHLLNHANLFGGGYIDQCRTGLQRLARQMTS